ncbi:phage-related lysozyme (muraminidase) [Nostoc sp. PCC 7524]|uniref:glycoside hydrolase family protein n=1 Tax=Nostoc sp. (strain ATCC 29411 / PCC 7524) TaxID=28072 RepID=UPI00029EFF17|nr:peptidoglycan-binding protein [Nostoc sp. PCC 7524]AFY47023.1 phage-related lysozyme (muraminidase) [Nostoc sp. PCC 7524]
MRITESLRKGSKGSEVTQLQELLIQLKLDPGPIDGDFGDKTEAAVKQFQKQQGLNSNGIVEIDTQNALNQAIQRQRFYGGVSGKLPLPGVALIQEFEGCKLEAYPDPLTKGKPYTIGWGSTRKKDGSEWKLGDKITQQEADELLILQLESRYLPPLEKIPGWQNLNPYQQGALLSFAYNLGPNFFGAKNFETITRVLRNQQWEQIEAALVLYINPGSPVEKGLRRRRVAEAKLFLQPMDNNP